MLTPVFRIPFMQQQLGGRQDHNENMLVRWVFVRRLKINS